MNIENLQKKVSEIAEQCVGRIGLVIEMNGHRIKINHTDVFSAASLIKIPILIEGFRQHENRGLDLYEYLPVLLCDKVGGAGVLQALSDELRMKIIDLMALMITVSDNTATNILIDRLGIHDINQCIKALHLQATKLNRKMMDFEALTEGIDNFTTPMDMVACLKAIDQEGFLTRKSSEQAFAILEKQQFKNKLGNGMDLSAIQFASKTGELPGVEHDCAIIKYGGRTLYTAVLIDRLPDQEAGRKIFTQIGKVLSQFISYR